MLRELRIQNFAIIDQLELKFQDGLIVFTGETGAGKSIILDALDVLLGGKADGAMVRSGEDRATIEGLFELSESNKAQIIDILRTEELDDGSDLLIIAREIRKEGRTITRVNGRSVNNNILKEIGANLIDIHGQSEHLSIFDTRTHIELLDRFSNLSDVKAAYHTFYNDFTKIRRELKQVREIQENSINRSDMLKYQLDEITKANIKPGDDVTLKLERDRLANAEALSKLVQQALQLLDDNNFDTPSINDQAGNLSTILNSLARLDSGQNEIAERTDGVLESLAEITHDLRVYSEQIEFNPQRLEILENRLNLFNQLFRKYGGSVEAVLDHGSRAATELDTINNVDEKIGELEMQMATLLGRISVEGKKLTEERNLAALLLSERVEKELDDLKMASAKFNIDIQTSILDEGDAGNESNPLRFDKNGFDKVEFLIAPNQGEGLKPLVKIASGGETSRLMLALKNTLAREDNVPTLVFDEIDQGIGGRVGTIVGQKLSSLTQSHQVFCITHLPQLAAFGSQHFKVEKQLKDNRTITTVKDLNQDERIIELAQMFGDLTEGTLTSARELLAMARS